jgi:hypothetical protein
VLVSATVTADIQKLATKVLGSKNDWAWAKGAAGDADALLRQIQATKAFGEDNSADAVSFADSTPQQLAQSYMVVNAKLRLPALTAFLALRAKKNEKVVVFMSTCDCVDYHHELFTSTQSVLGPSASDSSDAFGSSAILRMHGNVPHAERTSTISKFGSSAFHAKRRARLWQKRVTGRCGRLARESSSVAEAGRWRGCRGETPRTPPAAGEVALVPARSPLCSVARVLGRPCARSRWCRLGRPCARSPMCSVVLVPAQSPNLSRPCASRPCAPMCRLSCSLPLSRLRSLPRLNR